MFQPQFLAIFRELISFCSLFGRSFTYMIKIVFKLILNIKLMKILIF